MRRDEAIRNALGIASQDLRWCYREKGIVTGSRNVYWSWDSFFASLGIGALGDHAMVRKNLELYLSLQNERGLLPKRIAHPLYWLKFIKVPLRESPEKQKPTYWNAYYTAASLAQNPTWVIALHNYCERTGDLEFFRDHRDKIERLMAFMRSQERANGLLWEGLGGGWAESVLKRGAISFTNMCYARAAWCLEGLYTRSGDDERRRFYHDEYRRLVTAINTTLWHDDDGGYYSDWYGRSRHHHFATDGNLLAIMWGIASASQAVRIQKKIGELSLEDDIPIKLAYDKYNFWRVYIFNRLGGVSDYHVGFSWTWLGCIDVLAKVSLGQKEAALRTLEKIAAVIARDGTVHETYQDGKQVKTLFYKGEQPWAWGAGLFVYACEQVGIAVEKR